MSHSNEQIARGLAHAQIITSRQLDVWMRSRCGESIASMRHDYPKETGRGDYHASTLYAWVARVNAEIETQRIIEREDNAGDRRGHTVASGSRTRRTGDPTGTGFVAVDFSSWNEEQLRRYGILDRWSRKREVFIVKRAKIGK